MHTVSSTLSCMLLSSGPSIEFMKYFQILSWIFLFIAIPAIVITIYLHYRRKRTGQMVNGDSELALVQASPELLGYTRGDGEYVFFDHSSLISEYKKKLSYHHARFNSLKRDFDKLENRYREVHQSLGESQHAITSLKELLQIEQSQAAALEVSLAAKQLELEQLYNSLVSIPSKEDQAMPARVSLQNDYERGMEVH